MRVQPPFHAFTTKGSGPLNRIITEIDVYPAFDPASPPVPPLAPVRTAALWDTGATNSVITPALVGALALVPRGQTTIAHATGTTTSGVYIVNFVLPNQVCVAGIMVAGCLESSDFGAIVGMDVIASGDFAVTNQGGQTWCSFRYPPGQHVDYVAECSKMMYRGVGRNDPCPCGTQSAAGRPAKFKDCCGK